MPFTRILFALLAILTALPVLAQTEKFDLAHITAPPEWKRELKNNTLLFSIIDKSDQSFATLSVYSSQPSQGDARTDFMNEWRDVVARQLQVGDPMGDTTTEVNGWQVTTAASAFRFNNTDAMALLTVFSGYGKCMSFLITTNNEKHLPAASAALDNLSMDIPVLEQSPVNGSGNKPVSDNWTMARQGNNPTVNTGTTALDDGYSFNTTHFDDGWVSAVQPDWVEVSRNGIRVLVHYPNKVTDEYNSDAAAKENMVWDYLIGPRYSSLRNFERLKQFASYEPHHFLAGTLTDQTGRDVFVALFNKGDKEGYWLEFICPDRASFTREFGIDKYDSYSYVWDPLSKMGNYNKFAVSDKDLQGHWTTNFSNITQWVNVYTGFFAGASSYSSSQTYQFLPGNTYNWQIHVASGAAGNMRHQNAKSSGKLTMKDNWNISLSNMEGRPKTFPVAFRCVKGARILWIDGMAYGKQ